MFDIGSKHAINYNYIIYLFDNVCVDRLTTKSIYYKDKRKILNKPYLKAHVEKQSTL